MRIATLMIHRIAILFLSFLATSCQFFDTEKIPSEDFYKKELESIDWSEVDQYPVFKGCEELLEKIAQKKCFENTIATNMYRTISNRNILAGNQLSDTLFIEILVSQKGNLEIKRMEIDSMIQKDFPELQNWIIHSLDSMNIIAPAYKRGIPVKTQFTLPVVIKTE